MSTLRQHRPMGISRRQQGGDPFECLDASITRRRLVQSGSLAAAWALMPKTAHALSGRDPRFLCVVLRGALDGLAAVAPIGDPNYERLRGEFALRDEAVLPLDGTFALNSKLGHLNQLYAAGDALFVHAVATPYRNRSHFDGQDVLESGLARPGGGEGWLNRMLQFMPASEPIKPLQGLSIGSIAPLVMRGEAPTLSWQSHRLKSADDDTISRVLALYESRDPELARALEAGLALDAIGNSVGGSKRKNLFVEEMSAAARFLADPEGPRIAAISSDGWDTHAREDPTSGRLANLLTQLDHGIAALKAALGPVWQDTVVAFVTEFGRTVAINGTGGTDHGNGTIAILIGGAVRGGYVHTDWPGLRDRDLLDGRDLLPTTDLRAVLKGLLRDHFEIPETRLTRVFPESASITGLNDLIG